MTLENRELFDRDPLETKIPNDGVAQVVRPTTDQEWEVLRWELSSFVCEGQYEIGLDRILDSFLSNLGQPQQSAVWVSGFYGSGKSHLVRVLEYLWRDVEMPNGDRARTLATLPDSIRAHLTELSTAGKRTGGLWSAAGTLAAGKSDSVRLAFLSVLFESADLPAEYAQARFTIWAKENGYYDAVCAAVEAEGRTFVKEINHLYMSPVIAGALFETDPTLADSVDGVRGLLRDQFPPTAKDISEEAMFEVMDDVLRLQSNAEGKLPLTLVVLDEMQQYIGEDNNKALAVQSIVERCSARFESRVLFVATGQSALIATPTLQKLIDRFTVPVVLSDNDVETVVREVVLRKKPARVQELKSTIDASSGEIDRHLGGTRFALQGEEKSKLVPDYPVLPNRWRLWSDMLRAVDRAGKSGLVRSQLGLIHGGVRSGAGLPVGNVIGADYLYFDAKSRNDMLMSGVLLREVDEFIQQMANGGEESKIKGRLCALIFLISQMSQPAIGDKSGLRATAPYLADLLIEDLAEDGARMRRMVPELLEALVDDGRIVRVDNGEYRLLTQEDAEWEKDYRVRLAVIRDDATRVNHLRSERLEAAVGTAFGGLKLNQGSSKTPRKIELSWGEEEPEAGAGDVPVWIRDEWSVTASAVKKAAAEAGDESPTIFVLLPKHEADQIKETLASHAAAEETLAGRPTPVTDEGKAAQRAMRTRSTAENERLTTLFQEVVDHARIFQGGGSELTKSTPREAVEAAAGHSLIRLFPKFGLGDNSHWGKVVIQAREGAPDPLSAVGHHGELLANAVCKEVLAATSPAGTKGTEIQRRFSLPPFGWPRDAVSGAILTLLAANHVRAAQDGRELAGPKELPQTQIGKVTFKKEDDPPSVSERLAVKGLLAAAGIPYEEGNEAAQLSGLLLRLTGLADRAGGQPPLPEPPDTDHLVALSKDGGNQQFRAIAQEQTRLSSDLANWQAADQQREEREVAWGNLERLLRHAEGLPIATETVPAVEGIRDGRLLLDDPDPTAPLLAALTAALRDVVTQCAEELDEARRQAVAGLEAGEDWQKLEKSASEAILAEAMLGPVDPPDVTTEAKLLETLDATSLSTWRDRIRLVPDRANQARLRAAKHLEPESVTVTAPSSTIRDEKDLESYVEELRTRVQPHLDAKKTVII